MAASVKPPNLDFSSGHEFMVREIEPRVWLFWWCGSYLRFSLVSLSASLSHCLSQIKKHLRRNTHLLRKQELGEYSFDVLHNLFCIENSVSSRIYNDHKKAVGKMPHCFSWKLLVLSGSLYWTFSPPSLIFWFDFWKWKQGSASACVVPYKRLLPQSILFFWVNNVNMYFILKD